MKTTPFKTKKFTAKQKKFIKQVCDFCGIEDNSEYDIVAIEDCIQELNTEGIIMFSINAIANFDDNYDLMTYVYSQTLGHSIILQWDFTPDVSNIEQFIKDIEYMNNKALELLFKIDKLK